MKTLIMNFSGVYEDQQFYMQEDRNLSEDFDFLDLKSLSGVNCYCDDEAAVQLKRETELYPVRGLHFIDSGNYHYMTRLWLERLEEPFSLLVFDHHTDMRPPAFGGLLSCGGWIENALQELPCLKHVYLVGPDEEAYAMVEDDLKKRVIFLSRERLADMSDGECAAFLRRSMEESGDCGRWMYISVDKDVLCTEDASTAWSQGDMKLGDLLAVLREILSHCKVCGMDVCGECEPGEDGHLNEKANASLWELWKKKVVIAE